MVFPSQSLIYSRENSLKLIFLKYTHIHYINLFIPLWYVSKKNDPCNI